MQRLFSSKYFLYLTFIITLFTLFFIKNVHVEPIEVGAIRQIIHPHDPKGELTYDPHRHYDYIFAFVAKQFGYTDNFTDLAKLFWFIEILLGTMALIKLCNYIFKDNKTVLTIAIMLFLLSLSGQTDQKTMIMPLYLLSIYYFLKGKWLPAALWGGFMFYLHIGMAMWWFLTSFFALFLILLINKKVSLKQIIKYSFGVVLTGSPIIYFYLTRGGGMDSFSINYYYYQCWDTISIALFLHKGVVLISRISLMTGVFLIGYYKAKKQEYNMDNIMPIAIGVLIVYVLSFIFADLLRNGAFITLQFLRAIEYVQLFSNLLFAFLLAEQIKKNNYIFFFIIVFSSIYAYFLSNILKNQGFDIIMNIFFSLFLIYEIFELHILNFINIVVKTAAAKLNRGYFRRVANSINQVLKQPVIIVIFVILMMLPKISGLKEYIKSVLNIPHHRGFIQQTKREALLNDIAEFTNKNITNQHALLLIPFYEPDFDYFTKHMIFITCFTPIENHTYKALSSEEFRNILENDFNYSLEKLFGLNKFSPDYFSKNWEQMWYHLDENLIRNWKMRYGLTHVIREKEMSLNFPVLYENEFYTIYEIN